MYVRADFFVIVRCELRNLKELFGSNEVPELASLCACLMRAINTVES